MFATFQPYRGAISLLIVCGTHAVVLGALVLGKRQVESPRLPQEANSVIELSPLLLLEKVARNESRPEPPKSVPKISSLKPPLPKVTPEADPIDILPTEVTLPKPVVSEVAQAVRLPPRTVVPPSSDASHLNNPAPVYPMLSRKLGEQGSVLLSIFVLADGTVGEIQLKESSGFNRLDEAALLTAQQWKFVPARQGDEAIAYWYVQPVNFTLERV